MPGRAGRGGRRRSSPRSANGGNGARSRGARACSEPRSRRHLRQPAGHPPDRRTRRPRAPAATRRPTGPLSNSPPPPGWPSGGPRARPPGEPPGSALRGHDAAVEEEPDAARPAGLRSEEVDADQSSARQHQAGLLAHLTPARLPGRLAVGLHLAAGDRPPGLVGRLHHEDAARPRRRAGRRRKPGPAGARTRSSTHHPPTGVDPVPDLPTATTPVPCCRTARGAR